MKRKQILIAAVFVILITVSGCSEVTSPQLNNPKDPLSTTYPIPTPGDLTASLQGSNSVLLKWYDKWAFEKGFTVERSVDGGAFEKLCELPPNSKEYLDSGLDPQKSYAYRVNTFTENASSDYTRTAALAPFKSSYPRMMSKENYISAAFSHDAHTLATASSYAGSSEPTYIRLWTSPYQIAEHHISGSYDTIKAMAFSTDNKLLAGGNENGTIYLWDMNTFSLSRTINGINGAVNSLEFSPDGNFLVVASKNKDILVYDTKTWTVAHTLSQHTGFVNSVSFSRNGTLMASGSADGTVVLWNTSSWTVSRVISTGESTVRSVAVSPDGLQVAAAAGKKYYRWDTASGNSLAGIMTGEADAVTVAFSSDGKTIAGGCGIGIAIYDLNNQPYFIFDDDIISSKAQVYNTIIASPVDGTFLSLGYPICIWTPGPWKLSYK